MNSLKISVVFWAFVIFCFVVVDSNAEEKCDGHEIKPLGEEYKKKILEGYTTCRKKYAGTEGDKTEQEERLRANHSCFSACFEQTKGTFDNKGCYNKTGIEERSRITYPTKEISDAIIEAINACAKVNGLEDCKVLSTDDNCKAFGTFAQCWRKKVAEICKIETPSTMEHLCDGHKLKNPDEDYKKRIREGVLACRTKYNRTKGGVQEQQKKFQNVDCYSVCVQQAKGMLDDKGCFNKTGLEELVKQVYPTDEIVEEVIKGYISCVKENGLEDGKAMSMDDNCKAFIPFGACIKRIKNEVCKVGKSTKR